jgi:hypothetical protein
MLHKVCKGCNNELSIENFHKQGSGFNPRCKDCRREFRKKSENKPLSRYNKYKRDAKRRGIVFSLNKGYFFNFEGDPCYYCGEEVSPISLDRTDNDQGYIEGNVVSCCYICNSFKHVFGEKNFLDHVQKIYSYQNRKGNNDQQKSTSKKIGQEDVA